MTEPRERAGHVDQVLPGLYHWRIANSAIGGGVSSSHALVTGDASVFIDPVGLSDEALAQLPRPSDILLTARCHQRAAWRYRRELGARVWLPQDAEPADEDPDERYAEGDSLPGGLVALRTPGPEWPHYSFLLREEPGVLCCSDLVMSRDGDLSFVPFEYHEDPAATVASARSLLEQPFTVLCLAHGAPVTDGARDALRRLLDTV
jgi:glyoxylase-like metal-dependent hydrolase (beta-lactamase superfamily II)